MELIRRNGYYVPKHYEFDGDTNKRLEERYYDDVNASVPTIKYNKEIKKWELSFASADIGGYDAIELNYFFDTKEEAVAFIVKE